MPVHASLETKNMSDDNESEAVIFLENLKTLQDQQVESEKQRMELELALNRSQQNNNKQVALKAARLQAYFKKICEDERRSQLRNEQLLQDLDRIERHSATLRQKSNELESAKVQYENYLEELYPDWKNKALQRLQQQNRPPQQFTRCDDGGSWDRVDGQRMSHISPAESFGPAADAVRNEARNDERPRQTNLCNQEQDQRTPNPRASKIHATSSGLESTPEEIEESPRHSLGSKSPVPVNRGSKSRKVLRDEPNIRSRLPEECLTKSKEDQASAVVSQALANAAIVSAAQCASLNLPIMSKQRSSSTVELERSSQGFALRQNVSNASVEDFMLSRADIPTSTVELERSSRGFALRQNLSDASVEDFMLSRADITMSEQRDGANFKPDASSTSVKSNVAQSVIKASAIVSSPASAPTSSTLMEKKSNKSSSAPAETRPLDTKGRDKVSQSIPSVPLASPRLKDNSPSEAKKRDKTPPPNPSDARTSSRSVGGVVKTSDPGLTNTNTSAVSRKLSTSGAGLSEAAAAANTSANHIFTDDEYEEDDSSSQAPPIDPPIYHSSSGIKALNNLSGSYNRNESGNIPLSSLKDVEYGDDDLSQLQTSRNSLSLTENISNMLELSQTSAYRQVLASTIGLESDNNAVLHPDSETEDEIEKQLKTHVVKHNSIKTGSLHSTGQSNVDNLGTNTVSKSVDIYSDSDDDFSGFSPSSTSVSVIKPTTPRTPRPQSASTSLAATVAAVIDDDDFY